MKYFLLFLIFTASCLNAINFKERTGPFPYHLWFSAGLGAVVTEDTGLTGGNVSINFSKYTHVIKLRIAGGSTISCEPYNGGSAWDYGLLYGYGRSFGNIHLSYLCGISVTTGEYEGKKYFIENDPSPRYEMNNFQTFGFPLEIQLDLNRARPFGLSLSAFGNINAEKSFAGLSLNLLLGRLP
ncbi:MAG TPA: hypothetical protein PLK90_02875 [Clostridiales bacterium]|nr:hypothetical protein [Clostridiales bacterium]HQP69322.1 hypothetical protein [Clostridiales bacterium]